MKMTNDEFKQFNQDFNCLIDFARDGGRDTTASLLLLVYLTMTYAPEIQDEIHAEVDAVVKKWAARNRQFLEMAEHEEDREWYLNYEWPEDFE